MARTRNKSPSKQENRMVRSIDDLAEFEDFAHKVLPKIRKLLREGKKASDLYKVFEDELAARKLSIALNPNEDSGKALSAIFDIENRINGKPTEKREVEHKFKELPEPQLDSLLLSELAQLNQENSAELEEIAKVLSSGAKLPKASSFDPNEN